MFKFITHRPLWVNVLTACLLALVVFVLFILSLNWLTHHNESKTVPAVVGKSYGEAVKILEKSGFDVEIQDSVYVDGEPPLKVLKQVPESEDVVKINRTVYLTINRAVPPLVEMPMLVGFSFRSAVMELSNLGLKWDTVYKSDFAKNTVLQQNYKGSPIVAGTKIQMGTSINLVLGTGVGTEKFPVPVLIGMTYGEVKARLDANGLGLIVIGAPGVTDTANAFIFKQDPIRFDADGKIQYIHTGQLMNVWLQAEKPQIDSTGLTLPGNN